MPGFQKVLNFFVRIGSFWTVFMLSFAILLAFDLLVFSLRPGFPRMGIAFAICLLLAVSFEFPRNALKNGVASILATALETSMLFAGSDAAVWNSAMNSVLAYSVAALLYLAIGVPVMLKLLSKYGSEPVKIPVSRFDL